VCDYISEKIFIELERKKLEIFYKHFLIYVINNEVIYYINEKNVYKT